MRRGYRMPVMTSVRSNVASGARATTTPARRIDVGKKKKCAVLPEIVGPRQDRRERRASRSSRPVPISVASPVAVLIDVHRIGPVTRKDERRSPGLNELCRRERQGRKCWPAVSSIGTNIRAETPFVDSVIAPRPSVCTRRVPLVRRNAHRDRSRSVSMHPRVGGASREVVSPRRSESIAKVVMVVLVVTHRRLPAVEGRPRTKNKPKTRASQRESAPRHYGDFHFANASPKP